MSRVDPLWAAQGPMMILLSISILSVAAYGIANFQQSKFGLVSALSSYPALSFYPDFLCADDDGVFRHAVGL